MKAREDPEAYERYLSGMDASMRQKVALTAAHLLCEGTVADMGCGSGAASHALASLYPGLQVIGVDADQTLVERARCVHRLPNLSYRSGDVATAVFEPETLDGVFDSSVLHHVTSFTGYRHEAAAEALAVQAAALRPGGVLIVRDFLDPGDETVLLDLPDDDGAAPPPDHAGAHDAHDDDPRRLSSARLFERFAREFRSLSPAPGFTAVAVESAPGLPALRPGWRRFRLPFKLAAEFVLRKDYRDDWAAEVREEYTYFTQEQFESTFARLGLRVLASSPLRNPWILRHRFRGQIELRRDADGTELEFPPTNYIIAGEKVGHDEGVRFREVGDAPANGFLHLDLYRHRASGRVRDLVRRPHLTLDVLPTFSDAGVPYVVARMSYPRPILSSRRAAPALDGSRAPGYVTEPLTVVQADLPIGQTVEELLDACGIGPERIRGFRPGSTYYPSPGGTQEEVRSVLVDIDPVYVQKPLTDLSGFSTSGRVRAIEARQVLRAAQVGGLPDARLELSVYELLGRLGLPAGPWIGEAIDPADAGAPPPAVATAAALRARPRRRGFERIVSGEGPRFMQLCCATFEELDRSGRVLRRRPMEYVVPDPLGSNTVATAPLWRWRGETYLGVDDDDLPAAQAFQGNSELLVAPAWRLPRAIVTTGAARRFAVQRLASDHDLVCGDVFDLGGRYHPSPGLSPEAVAVIAVEVRGQQDGGGRALHWVRLAELVAAPDLLLDGHLRVVAWRAAHALGVAPRPTARPA